MIKLQRGIYIYIYIYICACVCVCVRVCVCECQVFQEDKQIHEIYMAEKMAWPYTNTHTHINKLAHR